MTIANPNLGIDLLLSSGDLSVGASGDLAVAPNGRITLLQDVKNLLDTLPGDLFGHPDYGAGLGRLAGEEDAPGSDSLVQRTIRDALLYDESVAPRIKTESITVALVRDGRTARYSITFVPVDEDDRNQLNLVWGFGGE